jgi:hypothetical protein
MTIPVAWTYTPPTRTLPVDFGIDLGDLANVRSDSSVDLDATVSFDFAFGVDQTRGFYFLTDRPDELSVTAAASLVGAGGAPASASGELGFLAVDVTDKEGDDRARLQLAFNVDLTDPDGDGRLTMGEMASAAGRLQDVLQARASGEAHVGLGVNVNLSKFGLDSAVLPSLGFDFVMDWTFLSADPAAGEAAFGGMPDVTLGPASVTLSLPAPLLAASVFGTQSIIAPAGDLNRDGYDDFAVGRQVEDSSSAVGSVLVFFGSAAPGGRGKPAPRSA